MNIMTQAHSDTRDYMAQQAKMQVAQKSYKVVFAAMLINCHAHYKLECKRSPVEWYAVEGHVVCPDTGVYIPVYEGTSKAEVAAASILWYVQNFDKHSIKVVGIRENGSVFVEKPNSNYK